MIIVAFLAISILLKTNYDSADLLGPLSVNPLLFLTELSLPIISLVILLKKRDTNPNLLLIPLVLFIIIIYLCLELSDASYITSFYDSVSHIRNGVYVTALGHSTPQIIAYFDQQPGVFWMTAILSQVCGVPLNSLLESTVLFVVKWTPLLAILLYVPVLYLLYKRLLGKNALVYIALIIQFSLEIVTYHYGAETFGRVIYWFLLLMLLSYVEKPDLKIFVLLILASFGLFFMHEGLTILVILASFALVLYPLPFKLFTKKGYFLRKEFILLPITLGVSWFLYLIYLTLYQAGNFVISLNTAIGAFAQEGTQVISSNAYRAFTPWANVVFFKSVYIFALIGLGLLLSFLNGYRYKTEIDKMTFGVLIISTIFFGGASIGLGGAGYIERLPSMLMPLIVYSLVKFTSNSKLRFDSHFKLPKYRKFSTLLIVVCLIIIMLVGPVFYVSGRNFHSVTYGEYYSNSYLSGNSLGNIAGLYTGLKVTSIETIINSRLNNQSITAALVSIPKREIIEDYYYSCSNLTYINEVISDLENHMSVVYSNPDASILIAPS